ncbi:endonuclease domain-containing protein [Microbacterium sp. NPDC090007]|uniref:endonuclease domain-containing protein n=1 Tax=Microbacterium sp. NPDC090007 TaxID=3364204 RepID=UPI00381D5552
MHSSPLPAQLGSVFGVRDAREAGVTERRLRANDLLAPFSGVRVLADALADTDAEAHVQRLRAYATRMPDHAFFSHVSAAVAWGLPLPGWALRDGVIDVAVATPRRHPSARGVRGHEVLGEGVIVQRHPDFGFRLSSPASTWAQLGGVLRHPYDLVAVGDAVVRGPRHPHDPRALGSLAQLERIIAAARRVGRPALREALPRIRDGAQSRPESWLRLSLVDANLPEPELQHEVWRGRRLVARLDAAYVAERVAVEYEGEHHLLDREQWVRDIRRYEELAHLGWFVLRVTADDLFRHPHTVIARVRAALSSRRG